MAVRNRIAACALCASLNYDIDIKKQKQRLITILSAVMFLFFLFIPVSEEIVRNGDGVFCDDVYISKTAVSRSLSSHFNHKVSGRETAFPNKRLGAADLNPHTNKVDVKFFKQIFFTPFTINFIIPVGKHAPPVDIKHMELV